MAADEWSDERARATTVLGSRDRAASDQDSGSDQAAVTRVHHRGKEVTETPKRGIVMPVLVSMIVLGGFAGAVWYAYTFGVEEGRRTEIPLVQAEDTPVKVKPDDPGGMQVANQDTLLLNQTGGGDESLNVERLLPEPETPQPREPAADPQSETAAASPNASDGPAPADAGAQLAEAPLPEAGQAAQGQATAEQEAEPAAPAQTESQTRTQTGAEAASVQTAQSSGTTDTGGSSPLVQEGDTVIQLAAAGSADAAQREWARLQTLFPDLLGDMQLAVQKVTVGGKEYHRMQTGPFPNRATAEDMCAQLKAKKQDCLVTRR